MTAEPKDKKPAFGFLLYVAVILLTVSVIFLWILFMPDENTVSVAECPACNGTGEGWWWWEKQCSNCDGKGYIPADRCKVCNGTGYTTVWALNIFYGDVGWRAVPCENCNGTGTK